MALSHQYLQNNEYKKAFDLLSKEQQKSIDYKLDYLPIFSVKPTILSSINESDLTLLRVATAMSLLWDKKPTYWLQDSPQFHEHFTNEVSARMLKFAISSKKNLESYQQSGLKGRVKILCCDDSCEECKKIASKTYTLKTVPELPYHKCTCNTYGCRCTEVFEIE